MVFENKNPLQRKYKTKRISDRTRKRHRVVIFTEIYPPFNDENLRIDKIGPPFASPHYRWYAVLIGVANGQEGREAAALAEAGEEEGAVEAPSLVGAQRKMEPGRNGIVVV